MPISPPPPPATPVPLVDVVAAAQAAGWTAVSLRRLQLLAAGRRDALPPNPLPAS
jgi:hypothetical protein